MQHTAFYRKAKILNSYVNKIYYTQKIYIVQLLIISSINWQHCITFIFGSKIKTLESQYIYSTFQFYSTLLKLNLDSLVESSDFIYLWYVCRYMENKIRIGILKCCFHISIFSF